MRILKLYIKNLNSLKSELSIDFFAPPLGDVGLFAITGDTGAGKTTILDAITLALYGQVPRNKEVKEVLSFGASECLAELEFETETGLYRSKWSLWRSRKNYDKILGPKRELAQWSEKSQSFEIIADKIKEVNSKVEELTGLDYQRFTRSVLLAQGDFTAFLEASDKDRGSLLERITGTDIYTQLSKAAFERQKEEALQLEQLEQEIKNLELLLPEEVQVLEEKIKTDQHQIKTLQKDLGRLTQELSWYQEEEKGKKKRLSDLEKLEQITAEKQKLASQLEKLRLFHKIRPFQKKYLEIENGEKEKRKLLAKIEEKKEKNKNLELQKIQIQEQLNHLEKEASDLKTSISNLKPKWEATKKLDTLIEEIRPKLQQKRKEAFEIDKQYNTILTEWKYHSKSLKETQESAAQLALWMKEHSFLQALKNQLPFIKNKIGQSIQVASSIKDLKANIEKQSQAISLHTKKSEAASKEIEAIANQLKKAITQFEHISPEAFISDRASLIEQLDEQIKRQDSEQLNLERAVTLLDRYEELLAKSVLISEEQAFLAREEQFIQQNLLNYLDELNDLESQLVFKREIYEQQQLIANYEKDRANLEEGKPCPLCLSTDHPFRHHQLKPFVNKAKREFDKAHSAYEKSKKGFTKLMTSQTKINEELYAKNTDFKQLNQQMLELEKALSQLFPSLSFFQQASEEALSIFKTQLSKNKDQLQAQQLKRKKLKDLYRDIEQLERREIKQQNKISELKYEAKAFKTQKEQLEVELKEKEQITTQLEEELLSIAQQFRLEWKSKALKAFLETLEAQSKEFEEKQNKEEDLKNRISKKEADYLLLDQSLKLKSKEKQLLDKSREEEVQKLQGLEKDRKAILAERDPNQEEESMNTALKNLEDKIQHQLSEQKQTLTLLSATYGLIQEEEAQHFDLQENINNWTQALLEKTSPFGIENLSQLKAAFLDPEEENKILNNQQRIAAEETSLKALIQNQEILLEKLHKQLAGIESPEQLRSRQKEKESNYQLILKELGATQERIKANEERKKRQKGIIEERDIQKKEFLRWSALNEIIGSADGKKFRTFAQGLTLERLSYLANKHLKALNGRYELYKSPEEDLALEIIDTFQANNKRSIFTLSGGEKFLVSLALALGLSDLAGKNTKIRSLFIDEGFGTLDDNSLDLAITTLENLQSSGKTIGVISHVKELKERISTQIQIIKQSDGFSKIEIMS